MGWNTYKDYTPTRRITVAGGIKAQSKNFGTRWWAKRWIGVLESFDIGARLGRGKSYARSGQVTAIEIHKGGVTARVQGSRRTPYAVTIDLAVLRAAQWKTVALEISSQALLASKLLAGEMPEEIEQLFTAAKIPLFPREHRDLKTNCTCPDWSNPCKHIAAVYYLLGEEFDRDPFMLFRLRGIERGELLGMMGAATAETVHAPSADNKRRARRKTAPSDATTPAEELPADASLFWQTGELAGRTPGEMTVPVISAAVMKRLGTFPFWRGERTLVETLEPLYNEASAAVIGTISGDA